MRPHDPRVPARSAARGVQSNIAEAHKCYKRACELYASEVEERLAQLDGATASFQTR